MLLLNHFAGQHIRSFIIDGEIGGGKAATPELLVFDLIAVVNNLDRVDGLNLFSILLIRLHVI